MAIGSTLTAAALFDAIIKKLAANVVVHLGKSTIAALGNVSVNFGDHLAQSYTRCSKIRTILNRDESVDLLSLYVNLKFTNEKHSKHIDDYDLIERSNGKNKVVVTGMGGGGKTMFMRYLWISIFETKQNTIPLFIELRRFNDITVEDFPSFVYRSVVDPASKMAREDFDKALTAGGFTLILDGFDEVNDERRSVVENEILRLARTCDNLSIYVSSRPDDRFDSWQVFETYRVSPLSRRQVIDLVGKLSYDEKIKKKFIQRIKSDLYGRHQSFLSSPLLATMMLLTFDQFADIPEKIYLFYEQAFDTLFAKHDATKEAYKRKSHTDLSIDVFKKALSYFCLISYYDQRHEFTEIEVRTYIDKSLKMLGQTVKQEAFLLDLRESVCILQKEGLHWLFTHRSFQEYFSAYCLSNLVAGRMGDIFPHIVARFQDNVLTMCFDMNQDTLEAEYVLPVAKQIVAIFDGVADDDLLETFMLKFNCAVLGNATGEYSRKDNELARVFLHSPSSHWRFMIAMRRLYKFAEPRTPAKTEVSEGEFFLPLLPPGANKYELARIPVTELEQKLDSSWLEDIELTKTTRSASLSELKKLHLNTLAQRYVKDIRSLLKSCEARQARKSKSIDEIFSL